jgi:hypothetical protein
MNGYEVKTDVRKGPDCVGALTPSLCEGILLYAFDLDKCPRQEA